MDTRIFDFSICQIFRRIDRFTPEKRLMSEYTEEPTNLIGFPTRDVSFFTLRGICLNAPFQTSFLSLFPGVLDLLKIIRARFQLLDGTTVAQPFSALANIYDPDIRLNESETRSALHRSVEEKEGDEKMMHKI